MTDMVRRLIEIQKREAWSDGEMARQIGISRPSWNLIRHGKRQMWAEAQHSATRRFPELTRELLDNVMSGTERQPQAVA
jgi:hypothetical protein